ncbi:unnamed protein product, partial [Didymodactylos carnosus]
KKLREKIFGPNPNENITDLVEPLLHLLETGNDGDESPVFLDKVYASFNEFNEQHRLLSRSKSYEVDLRMIIGSTIDNIENKKFMNCPDVYFYLYRKIDEYSNSYYISTVSNETKKFKSTLLLYIHKTFKSSLGSAPDLTTTNAVTIQQMKISQFLPQMSLAFADQNWNETVELYLALCKLTFQAATLTNDKSLTWTDLIKMPRQNTVPGSKI